MAISSASSGELSVLVAFDRKFKEAPVRLCLFLLAAALATPAWSATPHITVASDVVEVSNLAPGAEVALLGVVHEPQQYHVRIRTIDATLTDDDRDGVVRYSLKTPAGEYSVWIAAELRPGAIAVFSPRGTLVRTVPATELRSPEALSIPGDRIEVLYVRPGIGAWRATIVDSGTKDFDRKADGKATIAIGRLDARGHAPSSPVQARGGDTAIAVDVVSLDIYRFDNGAQGAKP